MKWAIQVSITQIPRSQVDGFGGEKIHEVNLSPPRRHGTIAICAPRIFKSFGRESQDFALYRRSGDTQCMCDAFHFLQPKTYNQIYCGYKVCVRDCEDASVPL